MADLSDVTGAILTLCSQACYPNGTAQPSVTGALIEASEGWPLPTTVDAAMKAGISLVTVFPITGSSDSEIQVIGDVAVIVPPVHGMTITVNGNIVTLIGAPAASTEFATVILDGGAQTYSIAAGPGGTVSSLAAALALAIAVNYPGTAASGGSITIVGSHSIVARIGAAGTIGEVTHRQKHLIRVTVWSPTPANRSTIAKAIDLLLKNNFRLAMPDTSQALLWYDHTDVIDEYQTRIIYRRDLFYVAKYASVNQYAGTEVTSVTPQIDPGSPSPTKSLTG